MNRSTHTEREKKLTVKHSTNNGKNNNGPKCARYVCAYVCVWHLSLFASACNDNDSGNDNTIALLWTLWGFHFYSIGLNTYTGSEVRKPKNFVKSSHSSIIIIRVLSVTYTFYIHVCFSLSHWVCVCVSTQNFSIKSHETQIFLQDSYTVREHCALCIHIYKAHIDICRFAIHRFTPTLYWYMTEIASFFVKKEIITHELSAISSNLILWNVILFQCTHTLGKTYTHTHQKKPVKRIYTNLCVTVRLSITLT